MLSLYNYVVMVSLIIAISKILLVNAKASGDVGIGPVFRHLQTAFCSPAHLGGSSVYNNFSFYIFTFAPKIVSKVLPNF